MGHRWMDGSMDGVGVISIRLYSKGSDDEDDDDDDWGCCFRLHADWISKYLNTPHDMIKGTGKRGKHFCLSFFSFHSLHHIISYHITGRRLIVSDSDIAVIDADADADASGGEICCFVFVSPPYLLVCMWCLWCVGCFCMRTENKFVQGQKGTKEKEVFGLLREEDFFPLGIGCCLRFSCGFLTVSRSYRIV